MVSDILEPGTVALVGAGPGDPGLITLRGMRLLEQADTVVYDYLASPKLLRYAPTAQHLFVGKIASRHSLTQDQINALLIEKAQAGHKVVRLKGGDPFVFGRGGEEAEALRQAGIPFLVVPGITAAIAAPAYAGIPVTHRDFNSSFTLITGHEKEQAYQDPETLTRTPATGASDLDWSSIAKLPCLAFYMGVKSLPRITEKLIQHGMDPQTPAATVQWGTTPRQRTCVATLQTLTKAVQQAGIGAPAITIIGKVVNLRQTLNWFESRPLFGQTIVVTRTRDQASELSACLETLGAHVLEAPTIEVTPNPDLTPLNRIFCSSVSANLPRTFIFTSSNGVRFIRDYLRSNRLDARSFADSQIAVIGQATAQAVRDWLCIEPDIVPERAVAETLAETLIEHGDVAQRHFVLLRAEIGRPVLVERLRQAGATVEDIPVYQTRLVPQLPEELLDALAARQVHWISFTSSSTVQNFISLLGNNYQEKLAGVRIASIGPITTQTIRSFGLEPTVVSEKADVVSLVRSIVGYGVSSGSTPTLPNP